MNDSIIKHHLELFLYRVQQTRDAQRAYSNTKTHADFNRSKRLETQLDNAVNKLLSMGYSTEEIKAAEQAKMF